MLLAYKYIQLDGIITTGAAVIFPLTYFLGDIITEVYGFDISKKLIWTALFCELVFVLFTNFLIHLPSPANFQHQTAFNFINSTHAT